MPAPTESRKDDDALAALASRLRRPRQALEGLAKLVPGELAQLELLIDAACIRQQRDVQQALRRALPQPLRSMLLPKPARPP